MERIHISKAQEILNREDPVKLEVYEQKSGKILVYNNCVSISNTNEGTRRIKILESKQIRSLRDCCIRSVNDLLVYL